jgi:LemA protein
MNKTIAVVVAIVVVVALWGFSGYNSLVTLNENIDAQWAKVETQYQRRFDLIPNLVNSVKAVLTQEQTVFSDLAEARANYAGAATPDAKAAAASQVETSLGRLIAVVEAYPTLASSGNVRDLMTQLEGTENRVSVERTRFNDEVRAYNTAVKRFPRNVLAALTGFGTRAYFEAAPGTENAPQVNF